MTGIFYVRKPDGTLIKLPNSIEHGADSPYFEGYDFYANRELINSIYDAVCMLKTGEKLEIVCELEE